MIECWNATRAPTRPALSSSYQEGRRCPLAAFGYNRDGKQGKQQIVFGLLCSAAGCPVAVEVFPGNTADPATLGQQVEWIRKRFGIARIALVGDRGMLTTARIREDLQPAGLDWISALKSRDLRKLVAAPGPARKGPPGQAPVTADSLVPDAVAEITSPDFPGERLLLCLNPRLRAERRRKREELLQTTERSLAEIASSVRHKRLAGEAAMEAYKSLSGVERAFRTSKDHLRVRQIHVYSEDHVRGHVFLCMLAYYVEWHMRRRLALLRFQDDDPAAARAQRHTPVEPARVSDRAKRKADTKLTANGLPAHSFPTLLADLSNLALNQGVLPTQDKTAITVTAKPTQLQSQAFDLLGVDPNQTVPITGTG